jgi:aminoglycoside phosphotransferase family enzyme/predicted kinase
MNIPMERIIEELSNPAAYPHDPVTVQVIQTHISAVFIADDLVYKVKKPVDFGFLDFTTLEKRKFYCHQELELNRRLSPGIYLDVVPITEDQGRLAIGEGQASSEAVDYAVKMKRLDERLLLSELLPGGKVDTGMVETIAGKIAAFHQECGTSPEITRIGGSEAVEFNTEENFQQVQPYIGTTIDENTFELIVQYTRAFREANLDLLRQREEDGWVRDGHGDLHSQHICMTESIEIFDCIEFNQRFRYADVLCDAAFLGMDLDRLGYGDFSRHYRESYLSQMGQAGLEGLYNFYACYRAVVRGKVEGFRSSDPNVSPEDSKSAADSARGFFDLAANYARKLQPPTLFVTMGLMGSGKSSLARALEQKFDLAVMSSDIVRKELSGLKPTESRKVPFGKDIYAPESTTRTYNELHSRAQKLLASGSSVIIDASYIDMDMRKEAISTSNAADASFIFLWIDATEEILRERLRLRAAGESISDGREEILEDQLRAAAGPGSEIPGGSLLKLDGQASVDEWVSQVYSRALAI